MTSTEMERMEDQCESSYDAAVADALAAVAADQLRSHPHLAHASTTQRRALLGDVLISNGAPLSQATLSKIDRVFEHEASTMKPQRLQITPQDLGSASLWHSVGDTNLVVWKGDMLRLQVGAMVNAANEQGLGCFQPSHRCIDNVLHRAAGPRLRESCRSALLARPEGHQKLPCGGAPLVTPGWYLSAEICLHITGPQLRRGRMPAPEQKSQLQACYTGCLDSAKENGIRSIAFCCISTGIFGYPQEDAAEAALEAVRGWLGEPRNEGALAAVVFVTFLQADYDFYKQKLAP